MKSSESYMYKLPFHILAVVAGFFPIAFIFTSLHRIAYPFELEWMEGGMVDHVARVLSGQAIYVEPSIDYVPFIYPPLYYYVSAGLSSFTGLGFLSLRLVSLVSALGSLLLVYMIVKREAGSILSGLLALCFASATYSLTSSWLDLARVDSLFLLLLLGGLFLLRFGNTAWPVTCSALLFYFAFLTKQSALPVGIAMAAYAVLFFRGRLRFLFPLIFGVLVIASTMFLMWTSNGWYGFYVFDLPGQHPIRAEMISGFWTTDVSKVTVPFAFSILFLLSLLKDKCWNKLAFYTLFLGSTLAVSWASRLHEGGIENTLIPFYFAVAACFAAGFNRLVAPGGNGTTGSSKVPLLRSRGISAGIAALVCIGQFLLLLYDPRSLIPGQEDELAGHVLIDTIRQVEGEVYLPFHGHLSSMAGKSTHAHAMAVNDILRGDREDLKRLLSSDVAESIRGGRFGAVILDSDWWGIRSTVEKSYNSAGKIFDDDQVFWPITGMRTRPEYLYLRKESAERTQPDVVNQSAILTSQRYVFFQ